MPCSFEYTFVLIGPGLIGPVLLRPLMEPQTNWRPISPQASPPHFTPRSPSAGLKLGRNRQFLIVDASFKLNKRTSTLSLISSNQPSPLRCYWQIFSAATGGYPRTMSMRQFVWSRLVHSWKGLSTKVNACEVVLDICQEGLTQRLFMQEPGAVSKHRKVSLRTTGDNAAGTRTMLTASLR